MTEREALDVARSQTMGCWWGSPLNGLPSGALLAIRPMLAELRAAIEADGFVGRFMGWSESSPSRQRVEAYDVLMTAYGVNR